MTMESLYDAILSKIDKFEEAISKDVSNNISSLTKEYNKLLPLKYKIIELKKYTAEMHNIENIINTESDEELRTLAKEEKNELEKKIKATEEEIKKLLINIATEDEKDYNEVIMEIRAGAGGEEAALFAADLFRMYSRYADKNNWTVEVLSSHPTDLGGFKEIIFSVKGKNAWSKLKYEGGVHRVQRIPITESSGRIHTSTCAVATLIEPKEDEIIIREEDLKIEAFRASGKGGQHVNKTSSAIRITHIPTNIVVQCQDERSQFQNKAKAMKILRARLLALKQKQQEEKISQERKSQIGTMERAEKIRTYNFLQNRVTDHRINLSVYQIEAILNGNLDLVIDRILETESMKKFINYITSQ
jgi:peptide chain release factor 1